MSSSSSSTKDVAVSDPNNNNKDKMKMVVLKSCDGETFEVSETVAMEFITVKHVIEDMSSEQVSIIPLLNVTGKTLGKVIDYCKKHAEFIADGEKDDSYKIRNFNDDFLHVDQTTLFDLILAANYLNIKSLLDLTCQTVANMMNGKTPEEIRDIFHIVNDYTPDEEEHIRTQHAWAFQDPI